MKDEVSEYERLRLENIRQNELELEKLGLMLPKLTQPAPFKSSKRRRLRKTNTTNRKPNFLDITNEVPIPLRRSSRVSALNIRAAPAIDKVVSKGKYELYNNEQSKRLNYNHKPNSKRKYPTGSNSHKREPNLNMKPSSIKNIDVAVAKLQSHIGNIISPMGGQVKRAVMELGSQTSCSITPTFSRMSGIQEWKNCIFLFVNVYGDDYKNVFLDGGRRITWFAQSRQNEETPVVQRMIYMCGGEVEEERQDDKGDVVKDVIKFEETTVCLFCREKGKGYVYCGLLDYVAHDPSRLPIRFIWSLNNYRLLSEREEFSSLIKAANQLNADRLAK